MQLFSTKKLESTEIKSDLKENGFCEVSNESNSSIVKAYEVVKIGEINNIKKKMTALGIILVHLLA